MIEALILIAVTTVATTIGALLIRIVGINAEMRIRRAHLGRDR